jgi:hypothetical protein
MWSRLTVRILFPQQLCQAAAGRQGPALWPAPVSPQGPTWEQVPVVTLHSRGRGQAQRQQRGEDVPRAVRKRPVLCDLQGVELDDCVGLVERHLDAPVREQTQARMGVWGCPEPEAWVHVGCRGCRARRGAGLAALQPRQLCMLLAQRMLVHRHR